MVEKEPTKKWDRFYRILMVSKYEIFSCSFYFFVISNRNFLHSEKTSTFFYFFCFLFLHIFLFYFFYFPTITLSSISFTYLFYFCLTIYFHLFAFIFICIPISVFIFVSFMQVLMELNFNWTKSYQKMAL